MSSTGLAVLVIDEDFAIAKNSGKRMRTVNLLEICARSFAITYVAYVDGDKEAAAARRFWEPLGVTIVPVIRPRVGKSGVGQVATALRTLGRRLPASVTAWQTDRFRDAVNAVLESRHFDLIHCEITQMAWAVPFEKKIPTVLNAHNVEAIIWERLAGVRRGPLGWVFRDQAKKMGHFEKATLPRFDEVVCVSEIDRERIETMYGRAGAKVLPNGVEPTMRPLPSTANAPILLYPGSLDWRPAQDGAVFLLKKVLPLVRRRQPDVRVVVAGKSPPGWLLSLCARTPRAECHADVPDMEPFYREAAVVVVPLRVGSGSRLKILEALAYGRAVVSTAVGAEGLSLVNGVHLTIADGAEAFAAAVGDLLSDPNRRACLSLEGRKVIDERYQWPDIGAGLVDVWCSAARPDRQSKQSRQGEVS